MSQSSAVAALRTFSKGAHIREEGAIVMQLHTNFESLLHPTPLAVFLLGKLMCLSSGQQEKLIPHECASSVHSAVCPPSIPSTLAEITSVGYKSLNEARESVPEMQQAVRMVERNLKDICKSLRKSQPSSIPDGLSGAVETLITACDTCVRLSQHLVEAFDTLCNMVHESITGYITLDAKQGEAMWAGWKELPAGWRGVLAWREELTAKQVEMEKRKAAYEMAANAVGKALEIESDASNELPTSMSNSIIKCMHS